MKFLLVLREASGCGYTIGCGVAVRELEFDSEEGAAEGIFAWMAEKYGDPADGYIDKNIVSAKLYVVSGKMEVDLDGYRSRLKAERAREAEAALERAERMEFRRLQQKYGTVPKTGL